MALTAKAERVSLLSCGTGWMPKVEVPAAPPAAAAGAAEAGTGARDAAFAAAADAPNGSTTAIPAAANMVVIRDATSPSSGSWGLVVRSVLARWCFMGVGVSRAVAVPG